MGLLMVAGFSGVFTLLPITVPSIVFMLFESEVPTVNPRAVLAIFSGCLWCRSWSWSRERYDWLRFGVENS